MENQFFYSTLNQLHPITAKAWDDLNMTLEEKNIRKNAFLISEGEKASYCYFLVEGVVRVFYSNGESEYNKTFFVEGTFPTPLTALLSAAPSQLNFQALTPVKLLRFSYASFRGLFNTHRCLELLFLKIMEFNWIKKEQHDIRMVTNSATVNYQIFQEEFPKLEQLIPQYHIASYLGITPIQLSRIRAKLANSAS
ncbi:Crp/Fnr family transcriptional regulator [Flammeovirgaceae bacterium SG7u.111]|nr:Crp/Fnr family transcriptional regulator [Flammeovirgaceae bacterium SG7u.132]WPO34486.1 Crp/Fnr family transcriptional regulator [Flammeovirgaceae bacterium SG7u.111]